MTMRSATQAAILSAGSRRYDGAVLPLPESLKIKGGAVDKVLGSLKTKGLIVHRGARRVATIRRGSGSPAPASAISVETDDDALEGATRAVPKVEDDPRSRLSMGEHACR